MEQQVCYFKRYQKPGIWHYIKLYKGRQPPAQEVVNFLNTIPHIDYSEFDMNDPGSRIEYNALFEAATPIEAKEYEQAY